MLEFATTTELIEELMGRDTFVGLVLSSEDEQKFEGQMHDKFKMYATGNVESTIQMLQVAVDILKGQAT